MILVYSHKITPRLTYIFRQIFIRILELPVDFTSSIEKFVSHSGPKLSYTHQPLGKEFSKGCHDQLFQQGIQEVPKEVSNWSGLPALFKLGKTSQIVRILTPSNPLKSAKTNTKTPFSRFHPDTKKSPK